MSSSTSHNNRPLAVAKSRLNSSRGGGKETSNAATRNKTTSALFAGQEEEDDDDDAEEAEEVEEQEEELPYEERELRNEALRVLANEESLIWLSKSRNESVLQTRIYCEARAAGLSDDVLRFDYTMDMSEEKDKDKEKEKGNNSRVVSGSARNLASSASGGKRDKDRGRRSFGSAR